ncbi:MAG: PP2C family protein-serine/threonine phosphatase [Acidiferrobacterales bacterium]
MKYELARHSSPGSRRTNEDRIAYSERENAVLMAVADGLGGHAGGELAAQVLTQTAIRAFERIKQPAIEQPSAFLALTILQAHNAILLEAKAHDPPIEPRTTCVLCLVQDGYAYWAHVGDSRLYLFRNDQVVTRTLDHTATERLRADGVLTEEEMLSHPEKSRLLKCVGGPVKPTISIGEETALQHGDVLLLCTDGLWEAFSTEELADYLDFDSLDEALEEMAMEAEDRRRGVCDNVSAIGLRWRDSAPTTMPLQANQMMNVDQDALWEIAKNKMLVKKARKKRKSSRPKEPVVKATTPAPKPRTKKKSYEAELEELENYMKKLERK